MDKRIIIEWNTWGRVFAIGEYDMKKFISFLLLVFATQFVFAEGLTINTVSFGSYGDTMVSVKVKITNNTNKHIKKAEVTCILLDNEQKEITFQKHYVVKSFEGGLEPNKSIYFEYVIDADPNKVQYAKYQIDQIKY